VLFRSLENIISTILLKEKISDDEKKLLNEIFDSLNKDKDIDILNSSILMKMIDKVYLIEREVYKDFFNDMFNGLIDSDLLRYYKIISTGKRENITIPTLGSIWRDIKTKVIHEVIAFCSYKNTTYVVTFIDEYNEKEKKIKGNYALEPIKDFNEYYQQINNNNSTQEKFSFKKAISSKIGKKSLLFRNNNNSFVIEYNKEKIKLYKNFNLTEPLTLPENN